MSGSDSARDREGYGSEPPASYYAALGERELVAALRRSERRAFEEMHARFWPLLAREARRLRLPPWERDEVALDVLGDATMKLVQPTTPVPRSVAAYLVTTLRNRVVSSHRERERRERRDAAASGAPAGAIDGSAGAPACSEASLRASRGAAWEAPAASAAVARLAAALDATLSEEERLVLAWVGQYVPHRHIAAWLGIGYEAATKRVVRLRARLRAAADKYASTLEPNERAELMRLLRRAGPASPRRSDEGSDDEER